MSQRPISPERRPISPKYAHAKNPAKTVQDCARQMKRKEPATHIDKIRAEKTKAEVEQIVAIACGYEHATDKALRLINRAAVQRLTELDIARQ